MAHITFVKKILANGELCKKCKQVADRLDREGLLDVINHIAIADERDMDSEGMRLAAEHNVTQAPFFVVEEDGGSVQIFEVFFKFRNYVSDRAKVDREDLTDLLDRNPDLDFI